MIYVSAQYANAEHTMVTGWDEFGNSETVPHDYILFRQPADGPAGFMNNGGVIEPYASHRSLEGAISAKLAELDEYRWQVEVGGVSFGGGIIRTDWNSQNKIAAAYLMAINDPDYEIPVWEVVPGMFTPLDNATIRALGLAVRDHVQATFTRKAQLHPIISALGNIAAVEAYDIASEW